MTSIQLLRVVAVSPGDVQAERDVLQKVIDELNRGVAASRGRRLSLWRWETDARPGLHLQGAQGLIDEIMDVSDADLVIGVFWKRFGTPTHDSLSGTEHELRRAWEAWQESGRPDVMVYFCTRACSPESVEPAQWQRVLDFRVAMPEQLWWRYAEVEEFERLMREHLTTYLLRLQDNGATAVAATAEPPPRRRLRFNVPLALPHFTGRANELEALDEAMGVADRVVLTQAITGLGGVGKSQLAARYLHERGASFDVVAWIRAEDGGIGDLARLATALGEPVDGLSPQERADRALHWLNHANERWLLVLDNVASPRQLLGCCPHSGHGRVLVTSRHHGMRQFGPLLRVDVFDEQTAIEYLVRQAARPDERAGAQRLAKALGWLPLALSHAGAYCATGTSFDEYLELLVELPASMLFDTSPEVFYEQTVASTWQISMQAAHTDAPLAPSVLAMAAHLAPEAIPKSLFGVLIDAEDAFERKRLSDAFNALHRFSLVDVDDETVSVHRLVQKTVRDEAVTKGDRRAPWHALAAVDVAFASLDDTALPASWPSCEQLLPHALTVADTLTAPGDSGPRLIGLLNRACRYLYYAGGGERAVAAADAVAGHAERILGSDHARTLTARANVAFSYQSAGRARDAIALGERLLFDSERVLGAEHPDTLSGRADLVVSYQAAGRTGDAIELGKRVLVDSERVLGGEHPDTLRARANLAVSYQAAGRTGDAIGLGTRVLVDSERVLGGEHPDTLRARANVAGCYQAAGRTGDAIELGERVLADRERVLGAEHPDTLRARTNLAGSYQAAGRTGDAIELGERVLADRERVLGAEHPDTLRARASLATSYRAAGRTSDAIAIGKRVLADRERVLGAEDPDTLRARASLAASYRAAGRTGDAIALGECVLADCLRILGVDHLDTLSARASLAAAYRSAGRVRHAIELGERVRADRERILGAEHPHTLSASSSLAASYRSAGRARDAIVLGEGVLSGRERILGAEHPDTVTAGAELAASYWSACRVRDAIELGERVLADRERILGAAHPHTLSACNSLVAFYRSAGRARDAIELGERVLCDSERVLGVKDPITLAAHASLAASYRSAGRIAAAISLATRRP